MHFAVLGNPIAHSLSPVIHSYFAKILGLKLSYERILVAAPFAKVAADFFAAGGAGCNVTVPCKLEACAFADSLDDNAAAAGAVNTLKRNADGTISGFNTDGPGLVLDLKRLNMLPDNARILIVGAGGAAQGIVQPLLNAGAEQITLANRHAAKAVKIAAKFASSSKVNAVSLNTLNEGQAAHLARHHYAKSFDLVINATSSSLQHMLPPLEPLILQRAGAAYDLMYTPQGGTIFTRCCTELGLKHCADGIGMLIAQAALSLELWTGQRPDIAQAIAYLQRYLQGRA